MDALPPLLFFFLYRINASSKIRIKAKVVPRPAATNFPTWGLSCPSKDIIRDTISPSVVKSLVSCRGHTIAEKFNKQRLQYKLF